MSAAAVASVEIAMPRDAAALPVLETIRPGSLLGELPEVNENAVAAVSGAAAVPVKPAAVPVTSKTGKVFDRLIFRTNADGSPFLGPGGRWMPRGGRKPGIPNRTAAAAAVPSRPNFGSVVPPLPKPPTAPASEKSGASPVPGAAAAVAVAALEAQAEGTLRTGYSLAGGLLGAREEWQPEEAAEHEGIKAAYVAVLRNSNGEPPSPWIVFIFACLAYILNRITKPKTSNRLFSWFPWLKSLLGMETEPAAEAEAPKPAEPKPAAPIKPKFSTDIA